ncbi:MAG: aminotransferase class V-fold PLP-dependent enzyme [Proteobacteria bacterium]|nr:aminotransferase class V-fold PLP-dependent enzyme [Pseudomonadota bacterium]
MIYLDNAATSFPKPKESILFMNTFIQDIGGNPGRSGHTLSVDAARIIFETREKLTGFINGEDSERLIFTQNGTESLNLAILGLLKEKNHVITTSLEHNSVMRPLTFLQKEKHIDISIIQCSPDGKIDIQKIKNSIQKNTKAVIINHGSNVIGIVQPIKEIKGIIGDIPIIVDACQTIGSTSIDIQRDNIDILCFSCHKSLYGIQGLGAIYLRNGIELTPLKFGGTGSKSESVEHPEFMPDKYECGTPNTPGIASLLGGLTFIEKTGYNNILKKKMSLIKIFLNRISEIDGIIFYGNPENENSIPVMSINIKNKLPSEVGYELNKKEIYVRVGLHCSPAAHQTIGTFPEGTVRIAPGYFTTEDDIDIFIEALKDIARK